MSRLRKLIWLWAPLSLYLIIQLLLHITLDLSDLPGAAGSWSIYRATSDGVGKDSAALLYQVLGEHLPFSLYRIQQFLSPLLGALSILGIVLGAYALSDKKGALSAGLVAACWTLSHYFGLLCGNDTLAFSLSWLGVGAIYFGVSAGPSRWPAALIGLVLLPIAVKSKELALPVLSALLLLPLAFKRPKWSWSLGLPLFIYTAYWAYAWFWPEQTTRLTERPAIHLRGLSQGWQRLLMLYERGLPEGKFDQLTGAALFLGAIGLSKKSWRPLLLAVGGMVMLGLTSYLLEQRTRPRYLAPAAFLSLISLGIASSRLAINRLLLPFICCSLLLDSWGFFWSWGEKREEMVGTDPTLLPTPPYYYRQQYQQMPELVLRDLSLTGGAELAHRLRSGEPIATMRLRDARERSIMAYSALYKTDHLILDPGKCCAGQPVDERCADRVVTMLFRAGYTLSLPTIIEGVERIYPRELRWRKLLLESAKSRTNEKNGVFWSYYTGTSQGGHAPCQSEVPQHLKQ